MSVQAAGNESRPDKRAAERGRPALTERRLLAVKVHLRLDPALGQEVRHFGRQRPTRINQRLGGRSVHSKPRSKGPVMLNGPAPPELPAKELKRPFPNLRRF